MTQPTVDTATKESILREKLTQHIRHEKESSKATLEVIERDGNMLRDYVVPTGQNGESRLVWERNEGNVGAQVWSPDGAKHFTVHEHAIRQAGDKFGIPGGYLLSLARGPEWAKDLAVKNLQDQTSHGQRQRVLVRAVGEEVRGMLSDKYRRLDSRAIAGQFITSSLHQGAELVSAGYDSTRMYMQALLPNIFDVKTARGTLSLAFGANFSTSDFGDGALQVSQFMMQVLCLNGAVGTSILREVHLGGQIPEDPTYSERTFRLDTQTQASRLRDLVENLLKPDQLMKRVLQIEKSATEEVDTPEMLKKLRKTDLSEAEVDAVGRVLYSAREEDGVAEGGSLWRLAQAVSRVGQNANVRRRQELTELAGKMLEVK